MLPGMIWSASEMRCWRQAFFPMAWYLEASPRLHDGRASRLDLESML
jgi:hypothetical protein